MQILRLEQQQQQQQLLSMEMVENVTFRTILTKLINVILALLAVVLVFVSTAANLFSPFLTSRSDLCVCVCVYRVECSVVGGVCRIRTFVCVECSRRGM